MNLITNPADTQAAYWNGSITRAEAQKVFDEFAAVIASLQERLFKLDALMTFVAEKGGITPEQFNEWLKTKTEEADGNPKG